MVGRDTLKEHQVVMVVREYIHGMDPEAANRGEAARPVKEIQDDGHRVLS